MTNIGSQQMDQLRELIAEVPQLSRYKLSDHQLMLLLKHLDLVIEKNKVVNLTRITSTEEALVLHILDSLLFAAPDAVNLSEETSFIDLGSGAGYPGIPLEILSSCSACLLDSVGKKVKALQDFVDELGLNSRITPVWGRAEELPIVSEDRFDYVVARAVAQSNVLIEYAAPLLRPDGMIVIGKARPSDEELEAAKKAASICGCDYVSRETYELPHDLGHREILLFKKMRDPRITLPRPVGTAKAKPLGLS